MDALARCKRLYLRHKIALIMQDDMIAACRLCNRHFTGRPDRADDGRPQMLGPLTQDLPNSAGGGVYKQDVSLPDSINSMQQIVRCNAFHHAGGGLRSEEHTSELQSLMRISYAVFCLKKKKKYKQHHE